MVLSELSRSVVCVLMFYLFFNDTATTEIYTYWPTLSLHDALPIYLASLGCLHRSGDVHRHRAELRVRHQPLGAEHLAEPPDDAHHVRGRDAAVEIDRPALDNLHQILGTDDIGARLTRLIGLRTLGEHADAHRLAGALGQRDDAAHHRSEEH